jgi:hypothetical protein
MMLLAIDLAQDVVAMRWSPGCARRRRRCVATLLTACAAALPHRFLGHDHAPRRAQRCDITNVAVEAMREPHRR